MSNSSASIKQILINNEGELRSGWRVAYFVVVLVIVLAMLGAALTAVMVLVPGVRPLLTSSEPEARSLGLEMARFFINRAGLLLAALSATAVCVRLEHRTLGSVGFRFHRGWSRDLMLGWLVGLLTLVVAVAIAALPGSIEFSGFQITGLTVLAFTLLPALFCIQAASEEIIFRGFPFQAFAHNLGAPAAVILTSGTFAAAHAGNPDTTFISTMNTGLAGIWLGMAYLATRSLWACTALHAGWNFAITLLGLPVSGIRVFESLAVVKGTAGPQEWLSGGSYGPEGGLAVTITLIAATALIWKGGIFPASDEMIAAGRHNSTRDLQPSVVPRESDRT
jgi:membrane protease YdiL (CAAX protease family)